MARAVTLFMKLVNDRNEWFDDGYGAMVLASDFFYQARYIVKSTKAGRVQKLIPPVDWMAEFALPAGSTPPGQAPALVVYVSIAYLSCMWL